MQGFLVVLLFALLAGCDGFSSLSDKEYVSRAEQYLDEGELKSASIELKNALSVNPGNPKARMLLGKLHLDMGNGPAAEKELKKAGELGLTEESMLPLLARSMLLQRKYTEILELKPSQGFRKNSRAELLAARGLAYLSLGQQDKAKTEIEQAIQSDSNSKTAIVGMARLYAVKGNLEISTGHIEKALALDNTYAPAWSLLGDLKRAENKLEAAIQAYTKAIENRFNSVADRLKRAEINAQLSLFDKAQNDIDFLKTRAPTNPRVNYLQGLLHFMQQQIPEAQNSFELALQSDNNYMPAIYYLGIVYFSQGNSEQAEVYISRYVDLNPGYIPGRKILAVIKFEEQNFKEVEDLVRPIVKETSEDYMALSLLANALLKQGKNAEAVPLLRKMVEIQPDSAEARARLGVGLLLQGEREIGLENLQAAIEIDPQYQRAEVLLILSYLQENSLDQALHASESFVERRPDSVVAHNLLGTTYLARKELDHAKDAFESAYEIAPGDPSAGHNLALLALKTSDSDKARAYYREILDYHQGDLTTSLQLAALEQKKGDPESARSILRAAIETHPDAVQPRIMLARDYLNDGKSEQALLTLGDIIESNRNNPEVLTVLGEIHLVTKDFSLANITFRRVVEIQPESAQAHFYLAQANGGMNNSEVFKKELKKSLELDPGYLPAEIAITRLLMLEGDLAKASKNIESIKQRTAEHPSVLSVEGELKTKLGETEKALVVYRRLFELSPTTMNLVKLAQLQWSIGEQRESIRNLEQWRKAHPDDVGALFVLANAYLETDRKSEALALYKRILELSESNLVALNNLAWYLKESNPEQAFVFAEQAYAIAPQSSLIVDTLAEIYLARGEIGRAQRIVERALEQKPEEAILNFRRAKILEAQGDTQEAIAVLQLLLEREIPFTDRNSAKEMLDRLRSS